MPLADALSYDDDYEVEKTATKKIKEPKSTASLKNILEAYLISRKAFYPFKAEIKRNTIVGFHPSGLYDACPRQIAFNFLFELGVDNSEYNYVKSPLKRRTLDNYVPDLLQTNNNAQLQLTFDIGHLLHFLIQYGYLKDYYGDTANYKVEVPIKSLFKDYLISGTADIEIKLQDGKLYVVDIKTMRSEQFNKVKTIQDISMRYIVQLMLYLYGLKIKRGIFLLVNKNDSHVKELHLDFKGYVIVPVLKTAKTAKSFLSGNAVPPILPECKKQQTRFKQCVYSSMCFSCTKANDLLKLTKHDNYNSLFKVVKQSVA